MIKKGEYNGGAYINGQTLNDKKTEFWKFE